MGRDVDGMKETKTFASNRVRVADVRIDIALRSSVVQKIQQALDSPKSLCAIHTLNPEILMQAHRTPKYAKILNQGNINVVDGIGLKLAVQRKIGGGFDRICGSDLIYDLAEMAEKAHRPLLLVGGRPSRLIKAKSSLKRKYPNLELVGLSPSFTTDLPLQEQHELEELIRTKRPCVVAVCLGAPRQETWIAQNRQLLLSNDVRVAAGLGGVVDFLSGEVIRAPKLIQAIGLEWCFRLAQEPQRLRRQISNLPEFALRSIFSRGFVNVGQH